MDKKIELFAHTKESFQKAIFLRLGKGEQQAGSFYTSFIREGKPNPKAPCFKNCPQLFDAIDAITNAPSPEHIISKGDDTSQKYLLKMGDADFVETVILHMKNGITQCISSQVGCQMGCAFCETARMGLKRNLSTQEIVSQVFVARHAFDADTRNLVFMGMGEPFHNFDNVMHAVDVLSDQGGFAIGERRITVSTCGRVEEIISLADRNGAQPRLAISVNASTDAVRKKIMPINRKYNLESLKEAMEYYCKKTSKEIFVEYVLIDGINDSDEDALNLIKYLDGLDVKVNLIPYNPQLTLRFAPPSDARIEAFAKLIKDTGLRTLVRHNKGQKIMAACGQLSIKHHQNESLVQLGQDVKTA